MAYLVLALSAWMVLSALTALRPGRRGLLAPLAYPVGWAAGELPAQAIAVELALLGLLWWWGWPRTHWISVVVGAFAAVVIAENLVLVGIFFYAGPVVRRAMANSPRRPLVIGRPRDDAFGSWWRTALQFSYHPRSMQFIPNIAYGPAPRHRLDVWRQSTTRHGAPVIFYIHGGAWTFGSKREQGRPMLHEFVARGWVVVTCNYRLAPTSPWPAQIEDVTRTLAWIKKYVANYGGDPDRVVVSGGSAGGHLAALLALTQDDPTWRCRDVEGVTDWSVRGCVSLYGVLEMTGDETHWHGLGRGLRALLEGRVVGVPYGGHEDLYRQMSPLDRITLDAPPFLVVQGRNDTLVDYHVARGFVARFREVALAPIYHVELPFTQHAFDVTASPRTSAMTRAVVAFAESVVTPRPALSSDLVAAYQSPPTELRVRVATGEWASAVEAARQIGPYCVVTADNPNSRVLDDADNRARREEMTALVHQHGVRALPTIARDPAGAWPDEEGIALIDQTPEFAQVLAACFEQNAFYEVTEESVRVRSARSGLVLT